MLVMETAPCEEKLSDMKTTLALVCFISVLGTAAQANDFPTSARVEYVLGCMDRNGGQNYDNLYACVCTIDKVAAELPFKRYEYAQTMSVMIQTPGEKGGAFRDAPGARKLVREYGSILETAEASCFINRVAR